MSVLRSGPMRTRKPRSPTPTSGRLPMSSGPQTLPPQHQDVQPGRESVMDPRPDYEPRYPGSGRLDGKVAHHHRRRQRHRPRGRGPVRARGRRRGDHLPQRGRGCAARRRVRSSGKAGACLAVAGDVGDPASFCEAGGRTGASTGSAKLDILVNNAAEQHPKPTSARSRPSSWTEPSAPTSSAISS